MEEKINDLKKLYLSEKAPMSAEEGFEDVLARLERENQTPVLKQTFLYIGLAILVLTILLSSVFILPENTTTKAIKNAPINLYNSLFAPSVTPVDLQTETVDAKPTSTPTPTTTVKQTVEENSQDAPGQDISNEKKANNPSVNDNVKNVKGVSDQHIPNTVPANPNTPNNSNVSEEKRNENSLNNPGTSDNPGNGNKPESNPAQEKSNGKAKNN